MRILLVVLFAFFLTIPICKADLADNGTFDVDASGWAPSNTDSTFYQSGFGSLGAGNPGGFAVLNNLPSQVSMSQTISGLNVGTWYTLSWDMESAFHCCGSSDTPGAGASIDGNTYQFIVTDSQGWTDYSETFQYTGTSNVLTFIAQMNGTDTDAGFDNISLNAVSQGAPEPATLTLLGLGSLGLGVLRRLRRKV